MYSWISCIWSKHWSLMMQNHLLPELWQNINQVKRHLTVLPNKHILYWMSLFKKKKRMLNSEWLNKEGHSHRSESVEQLQSECIYLLGVYPAVKMGCLWQNCWALFINSTTLSKYLVYSLCYVIKNHLHSKQHLHNGNY